MHCDTSVESTTSPATTVPRPTRILFVTPNFENNSLGRTYSLWLLAKAVGLTSRVVGVKGNEIWSPLVGTAFAADCRLPAVGGLDARREALREHVVWADLVIAVKPLPSSFGVAVTLASAERRPVLLDIDDPDVEVRTSWLPRYEQLARWVLTSRYRELVRLGRLARRTPSMVSNPTLAQRYAGIIIPHVRPMPVEAAIASDGPPTIRFVGSPRGHKGLDVLRSAVAQLADRGFRLEVTAPPPDDAHPWETWLGNTTLADGVALVASADIIVIPSLARGWSRAQLPAKLIDAMVHGRPVVASDLPPIRWALDEAGVLVPSGDVRALVGALLSLESPERRAQLGALARTRASRMFSVEAIAERFAGVVARVAHAGDRAGIDPNPHRRPSVRESTTVVIAVLTFRRPATLIALLSALQQQRHDDAFEVRILVVDNDPDGGAERPVRTLANDRVRYVHEPRPGIAAGRNRALAEAGDAELLIFIDDDERPVDGWLSSMLEVHARSGADGVVGPVVSEFEAQMDPWVAAGQFFRRRRLMTGTVVDVAATNNLLLQMSTVRDWGLTFDAQFGLSGGSDTLFTRQISARGGRLVWCAEAVVFDVVPAERLTRQWVLQRALRSGNSWSRVSVFLGRSVGERARMRLMLAVRGCLRFFGGLAQWAAGLLTRSMAVEARGARTAARGAGMLLGAAGFVYSEYARGGRGRFLRRYARVSATHDSRRMLAVNRGR